MSICVQLAGPATKSTGTALIFVRTPRGRRSHHWRLPAHPYRQARGSTTRVDKARRRFLAWWDQMIATWTHLYGADAVDAIINHLSAQDTVIDEVTMAQMDIRSELV